MDTNERLWKPRDLAEYLGTSVDAIHLMRSRGQLPPGVKIGARLYWRPQDIYAFVDQHAERAS